mmetsp:Transcript_29667/g.29997  ORF Transcript_29667/g.29997 Transcript_29667/m.29997 type:complete len:109 (+) Transcript_29667:365-691(+)
MRLGWTRLRQGQPTLQGTAGAGKHWFGKRCVVADRAAAAVSVAMTRLIASQPKLVYLGPLGKGYRLHGRKWSVWFRWIGFNAELNTLDWTFYLMMFTSPKLMQLQIMH